jgi:hypothetical protein
MIRPRYLLDSIVAQWVPMSTFSHSLDPEATWGLPLEAEHRSLNTLREKLIKIGARVVKHSRYVTFQLAEVTISKSLFAEILRLIDGPQPVPLQLPTGEVCSKQARVCPRGAKWSWGRVLDHQIGPMNTEIAMCVPNQRRIDRGAPVALPLSVTERRYLGNLV